MDFPPPPEAAHPFPSTGRQAFPQQQLSIASCLSPDDTFDVDKYRQYTASLLARARGRSAAILSNMAGGVESHATFLEKHINSAFVKSRGTRCVLGRNDTDDSPLCVIAPEESGWYRAYMNNFLLDKTDSFMAKSGIYFVCRTPVPRSFFVKFNPTIGSNVGVGKNETGRICHQLSCYFLDR